MNVLDVTLDPERAGARRRGQPRPARRPVRGLRGRRGRPGRRARPGPRARRRRDPRRGARRGVRRRADGQRGVGRGPARRAPRVGPRRPRGLDGDPIGAPSASRMDPSRACFFTPDGTTAVHRSRRRTAPIGHGRRRDICHDRQPAHQPSGRPAAWASPPCRRGRGIAAARRVRRRFRRRDAPARGRVGGATPRPQGRQARDRRVRGRRAHAVQGEDPADVRAATGIKVEFLTEPYDSFFAKAFQDGQSKAGQYDIYIMDDPWIPQYAAAGILEDLGAARHHRRRRLRAAVHRARLLAAAAGPARQGVRERAAQADRPADDRRPADADLPQRRLHLGARDLGRARVRRARRASRRTRSSTASSSAG